MIPQTEEQRAEVALFETGHRLNLLVSSPGWETLQEIFKEISDTYEKRLLEFPSGESDQFLRDLHTEAKVAYSVLELVKREVYKRVEMGQQVLLSTAMQPAEYRSL